MTDSSIHFHFLDVAALVATLGFAAASSVAVFIAATITADSIVTASAVALIFTTFFKNSIDTVVPVIFGGGGGRRMGVLNLNLDTVIQGGLSYMHIMHGPLLEVLPSLM